MLLDGRPREDMPVAERTARTGYLPQDPYLFSGTIRDNILLGAATLRQGRTTPPLPRQVSRCWQRPSCAALGEDLRTFPAGLETEIGELGIRSWWSAPAHSTGTGHGNLRHAGARTASPGRSVLGPGPGHRSQDRRWLAPALRPVAAIRPAVHGRAVLAPPAGLSPG